MPYSVIGGTGDDKWLFSGTDGCGVLYEVEFCAPTNSTVTAKQILFANAFNYTCNGVPRQRTGWQYSPAINNVVISDQRIFDGTVQKIGYCGCAPDEFKVICSSLPDGFCCIKKSVIFEMCARLNSG